MITCTFENGNQNSLRHCVADTIVCKNNQILMVKRAKNLLEGGKWGIIGGYMERDETIVQAVRREIMEETGWEIDDPVLLQIRDNPNIPGEDRQNISFVFFCNATKKTGEPDWESDEQRWFDRDKLPPENETAFDHADMIKLYLKYIDKKFPIPIFGK